MTDISLSYSKSKTPYRCTHQHVVWEIKNRKIKNHQDCKALSNEINMKLAGIEHIKSYMFVISEFEHKLYVDAVISRDSEGDEFSKKNLAAVFPSASINAVNALKGVHEVRTYICTLQGSVCPPRAYKMETEWSPKGKKLNWESNEQALEFYSGIKKPSIKAKVIMVKRRPALPKSAPPIIIKAKAPPLPKNLPPEDDLNEIEYNNLVAKLDENGVNKLNKSIQKITQDAKDDIDIITKKIIADSKAEIMNVIRTREEELAEEFPEWAEDDRYEDEQKYPDEKYGSGFISRFFQKQIANKSS